MTVHFPDPLDRPLILVSNREPYEHVHGAHGTEVRLPAGGLVSALDPILRRTHGNDDGLPGTEGVFSICTFWMAQALVLSGEAEKGERLFCRMLRHANHVGLYSEELDPKSGSFAGNFPQGLTHIALINCALALAAVGRG